MNVSDLFNLETILTISASLGLIGAVGGALGLVALKVIGMFVPERA